MKISTTKQQGDDKVEANTAHLVHWPQISNIILNWNGKEDTLEYLESVSQLDYLNSKQYIRNIPLCNPRSLTVNPESEMFSSEEKNFFRLEVARVNRKKTAGSAEFLFGRADPCLF